MEQEKNIVEFTEEQKEYFYDFMQAFIYTFDEMFESKDTMEEKTDEDFFRLFLVYSFLLAGKRIGIDNLTNIAMGALYGANSYFLKCEDSAEELFKNMKESRDVVKKISQFFLGSENDSEK